MCETKALIGNKRFGPCVFPFRETKEERLHFKCKKGKIGKTWCALKVNSDHIVIRGDLPARGEWAYCYDAKRCSGKDKFQNKK